MDTPQSPTRAFPFDARPLTDPVDPAALAAYRRSVRTTRTWGDVAKTVGAVLVFAFVGVMFLIVAVVMVGVIVSAGGGSSFGLSAFVPVLLILAVGGVIALLVVLRHRQGIRQYRLATFAAANGMTYVPEVKDPPLPGMIFDLGRGRIAKSLVRGTAPRFVEFANYQYTTGSGKEAQTHEWGYIAIRLDVPLPNIVLDSLANNGFLGSNLPARYDRHQRLSLEGDFDRRFALYCPVGYERDALYLFTPDIMARFLDHAAAFDVEIVDDWLFLYAQRQEVSTVDPAVWARMFATVGAVIDKLAQWARWRDERLAASGVASGAAASAPGAPGVPVAPPGFLPAGVAAPTPMPGASRWAPPPGVAAPGRRLKRSFSWGALIFGVVVIVWVFGNFFGGVIGALFSH
ncbi:hypothetical protein [Microbacterium capsulatum]|uniref:DUF3137 domain-containing protein n=1 Tax=Microbacterium capsulatum TaxID=3041921 RepID=A0ABU0XL32_9MICO|nr:hypothetical protein [Microbacterium sp. ASV81]MDQ4214830.1 hypothetical protein [Microbacterium sp. ASV81]